MNAVVALVILTGAGCTSPVVQSAHETVAHKVPCAIVLREQSANPFKVAQAPNTVTAESLKVAPVYKYPSKKKYKKHRKKKKR